MRRRLLTAALMAAATHAASAQSGLTFEGGPGFSFPTASFAGADLNVGVAFGVSGAVRVRGGVDAYLGWDWARFSAPQSFAGHDRNFDETGFRAGLRGERDVSPTSPLKVRAELGATWGQVAVGNPEGASDATSRSALGAEIGVGGSYEALDNFRLTAMLRVRSTRYEFASVSSRPTGDLRTLAVLVGMSRRF